MATITHHDESLVESNEILYSNANMIDNEPYYKNFTTIQNILQHHDEEKQTDIPSIESMNYIYRANRVQIKISSSNPYHSNGRVDTSREDSPEMTNQSVSDLTKTSEDYIAYNSKNPYVNSSLDANTTSLQANTISKLDETQTTSINTSHPYIDKEYFSRWYHDRYKCSAPMNRFKSIHDANEENMKQIDDGQSNIIMHMPVQKTLLSTQMNEDRIREQIEQIYGLDDADTTSTASSIHSSMEETNDSPELNQSTRILKPIENLNSKQQITIREYYPSKEMPSLMGHRSLSPTSLQVVEDKEYESFFHNHPELNKDPNPKIIQTPNSDQVTYKQNISVRYLVPPTPPAHGPLIIREIVPRQPPTPPPIVIKEKQPESMTPSPRIIREAPPTPPLYQDAQIITKIVPQQPSSSQSFIIEQNPPLPPKPQSIIIEKWLPYKPAPPREVIYERVIEAPIVSHFQPSRSSSSDRQFYQSTQFYSTSPPSSSTHVEQTDKEKSSTFEQFAWLTQQQIEDIEQQTLAQIRAHQQWLANQQQSVNYSMPTLTQLTTPALVVNHPPVTRTIHAYPRKENIPQQLIYQPIFMCPSYQ